MHAFPKLFFNEDCYRPAASASITEVFWHNRAPLRPGQKTFMIDLFSGLDAWVLVSLLLALAFVLAFEFINGFHDTANAVATVIYTKAMPPHLAVFFSGVFNFLGVLLGGVGVAYAIVHLLLIGNILQRNNL